MNYHTLINKAEDYIENNLDKKITLDEIAFNVGLSKYHFHRIFKQNSTETLSQFITRIKMERSGIYLVVNAEISITEIAYRYGYCDASSYNKAFNKHYGMNPSAFRLSKNIQAK
ncbi:MAG TPA: AraC family transcriptional regulator [Erysipelotrichaceae bacterium]|nr:AraC family transcriptional regulator [Erysipelotrichaceae bacterium]